MSADRTHVASVADFEDASRIVVDVEGREIAVFRTDDGFYALSNYCVHQGGPACEGAITGTVDVEDGELVYTRRDEIVSCPWHGWEFDITNGKHLADPSFRLPTYEVELDDGEVYVR